MQLKQFNILATNDKEEAISKYGRFIDSYSIGLLNCDVYQLFDFYVGLYHEILKNAKWGILARPAQELLPPVRSAVVSVNN